MPVQTRSMIKHAEKQRLRQQREFEEIIALSKDNEDYLKRKIINLIDTLDQLRNNAKKNNKLLTSNTIAIYRLTEYYLKILNEKGDYEKGLTTKYITLEKIEDLRNQLQNDCSYTDEQKIMINDEFDRYTIAVQDLFQ